MYIEKNKLVIIRKINSSRFSYVIYFCTLRYTCDGDLFISGVYEMFTLENKR